MSKFGGRSLGRLMGPRIKGVNTPHIPRKYTDPGGELLRSMDRLYTYRHPDAYRNQQDKYRAAQQRYEERLQKQEEEKARLQAAGYVDQTLTCQTCGVGFVFPPRDQEFYQQKGYTPPKRCPSCRSSGNKGSTSVQGGHTQTDGFLDKQLSCQDCGGTFTLTAGEQRFFQSKGYTEPKRCPDCRAKRKANR